MQVLQTQPLVILDGAHNDNGVEMLVHNLNTLFPGKKLILVLAILEDKPFAAMIDRLCTLAKSVHITRNTSERAAGVSEQAERVLANGLQPIQHGDVVSATRAAIEEATPDDIVIVTGSLYTIAEVLADRQHAKVHHV
jgi:dihydrofolate synthase/folylpolyglutamate synthase